jgi:hypothetical protein
MHDDSGLLVGRDPTTSKRLLGVAVVVFVAVFLAVTPAEVLGFAVPFGFGLWTLFVLAATLPILGAFVNDGALVSLALAAGAPFGFYLPLTVFNLGYPSESVLWGVGTATMFTVPLGLLGFAVGAGTRRLVAYAR